MTIDSETNKGESTQNFLTKKENTIQLLKKKLKILATKLIQASELTELEKEKETLSDELSNCKVKI